MTASTAFTRRVWKAFLDNKGHDFSCMPKMTITSAHPSGVVKARLPITQTNVNRLGSVHGGLISTLVDTCGSLRHACSINVSQRKGHVDDWCQYGYPHKATIHKSYLRSAGSPGAQVDIEARVESMGKTLAYTSVVLTNPENGKVLARGSHTKYIAPAINHPLNVKFDETGDNIVEGKMPE